MDRWVGKVAVVTGASAGIGAQIVVDLAKAGIVTVGLARRKERIEELRDQLPDEASKARLHAIRCDVSKDTDIVEAFRWIDEHLGGIDILVNNAGILRSMNLIDEGNTQDVRDVLNVNVLAVVVATREAFQSMRRRNVGGHIIMINSVSGHYVPYFVGTERGSMNIYQPSKHAITAMTEVLRQEFQRSGLPVKITSINPGVVRTEIFTPEILSVIKDDPMLESEDISEAILYVLATPPRVQIHDLTIKPMGERFL